MSLPNKVAQFDLDSNLVNEWVHGGPTTSIITDSGPVRSGSQYMILGWTKTNTGSTNVLNVDWYELRALTGT